MNYLDLSDIEKKVKELSQLINVPESLLPTFGFSRDMGYPHIEVDNNGYHYVVIERGTEWERKTSSNLNDLLYWIFSGVTFSMSSKFELENRIEDLDSRLLLFNKQIELLSKVNAEFGERLKIEIDQILKLSPLANPKKK